MKLKPIKRRALKLWRRIRKDPIRVSLLAASFILIGMAVYKQAMPPTIDPVAYRPLLNTIAKVESNGNYNAYYGNAANTTVRFTEMTVAEVLQWQQDFVAQGKPSSAVGRYQFIRPTLDGLVNEMHIDRTARFDEALQDRLAIQLIERRGSIKYVDGKLSREQFAANLAKEWASLPKIIGSNPDQSYYAGDGLNKSLIDAEKVFGAIEALKQ